MPLDAEALFREHHAALFRYLVRLTAGDEAMAKDAVQQAFLRLLETPPEDDSNVRAWLYTVATNAVRGWTHGSRRRHALLTEHTDRLPTPREAVQPDRQVEASGELRRLQEALDQLPHRDRSILMLRAEGLKHREIAEAVGTTTGSVGTLAARALKKLSSRMNLDGESA